MDQNVATPEINQTATSFWKSLRELRSHNQLCDSVLQCDDGTRFYVHRLILSAISPYFRALFIREPGKNDIREVKIHDMTSAILATIITFAYTHQQVVNVDNVEELLPAADYFQISTLTEQCCKFLESDLSADNCLGIRQFARQYSFRELESNAKAYTLHNFVAVANRSPDLLELPLQEFIELLSSDELNVENEIDVFEIIVKWLEHSAPTRKKYIINLLSTLRFGHIPQSFFTQRIFKSPFVKDAEDCRSILNDASLAINDEEISVTNPYTRPRIPSDILFAIGGWSTGSPTNFIETYDCYTDRWFLSVNTDYSPRAYHGLATVDGMIYVIGGFDGNDHFNTVRCFDPVTKLWVDKACMYMPRCYVSVCVLDNYIYALGGYDGRGRMNSGERYDPANNQWTLIHPMHEARSDASAAALNGKVYITGGFTGQAVLNSVEQFDPNVTEWTFVTNMSTPRSGVRLISNHGYLFALGGFNGFNRLFSGEKYDPIKMIWTPIRNMLSARSNFAAEVLNDSIYVIGGFNGSTTVAAVELYDDQTNEWFTVSYMNLNRSALSACVVKQLKNAYEYSYLSKIQTSDPEHKDGDTDPMSVRNTVSNPH